MRLARAIAQVIADANKGLFEKLKEEGIMEESALMRLMKSEVEKYAREYAKERDVRKFGMQDTYPKRRLA